MFPSYFFTVAAALQRLGYYEEGVRYATGRDLCTSVEYFTTWGANGFTLRYPDGKEEDHSPLWLLPRLDTNPKQVLMYRHEPGTTFVRGTFTACDTKEFQVGMASFDLRYCKLITVEGVEYVCNENEEKTLTAYVRAAQLSREVYTRLSMKV